MAEYSQIHTSCPSCGSSDGRSIYVNGQTHCFVCEKHTFPDKNEKTTMEIPTTATDNKRKPQASFVQNGKYSDLARRNLSEKTCRKWGYQIAELEGERKVDVVAMREVLDQVFRSSNPPSAHARRTSIGAMPRLRH